MICPKCGQNDIGQTGEYPCPECGLPILWDERKSMLIKLTPLKSGDYYEPIMLSFQGQLKPESFYPSAIVHIDTFWQDKNSCNDNAVYKTLSEGKPVIVEMSMTPIVVGSICEDILQERNEQCKS